MCVEVMEVVLGMATGMRFGSGRMLLMNRNLNVNLPKLSEAVQSIIVSLGDQKLYQSCCAFCCLFYCAVELLAPLAITRSCLGYFCCLTGCCFRR